MKKILFTLIPFLFLMSCASALSQNQTDHVPAMEELSEFSAFHSKEEYENELLRIKNIIDAAAYEEICGIYEESLNEWVAAQEELKIDRTEITFSRDALLMDEQTGKRLYNNFFVEVDIYLKKDVELLMSEEMDSLFRQIQEALNKTPYGRFTLNTLTVVCHGSYAGITDLTDFRTSSYAISDLNFQPVLDEEESEMQTQVYEYLQEFNHEVFEDDLYGSFNVSLRHFGIEEESQRFYMEIPIYSAPFDMDEESFKEDLNNQIEKLYQLIITKDSFVNYLKEKNVTTMTISLYVPWDREATDSYRIYDFDL